MPDDQIDPETQAIQEALDENERMGLVESAVDEQGVRQYRLTDAGRKHVEAMLRAAGIDPASIRPP